VGAKRSRLRGAYVQSMPQGPARDQAMQSVVGSWANNDPAAAAQWVANFAAGNAKDNAYADIARNWANSDVTQASRG